MNFVPCRRCQSLLVIPIVLLTLSTARAEDVGNLLRGTVKLAWDLGSEPGIAGYRVHWGPESGTYTETADVGYQVEAQLEDLPVGNTYFCVVTAYNFYGLESPYSNEVSFTVGRPPEARDSDGDGLSDLFEQSYSDSGDLNPRADPNGDKLTTLGEYAHGLDPLSPYNRPFSQVAPILVDGEGYLSIRYLIDPLAERFVTIHVERSTDISDPSGWERGRTVIVSSEASAEVPGLVEIVTRSLTPISSQPREFLRLAYAPKRDSDGDGLSDLFEESYSDSGDLDPLADLNGDKLTILGEYAHGLDPLSPYNRPFSQVAPILVDGEEYLSVRYLIDPLAERFVTIHVERSTDISDPNGWERGRTVIVSSEASSEVPGLVEIVTRSLTPISSQPREFLRFAYEPKGDSDGDGLSDLFEESYSDSGDLDPRADLNGDGLTILGEYAHGFDPLSPYNRPLSQVAPILVDGEEYLSIRYLIDPLAERFVTIHVERSTDISDPSGWERGRTVIVSSEASSEVPGLVEIVTRSLTPISSQPREFLRFAYEPKAP